MNLTLSLLAGLFLILPGIGAVTAWNYGGHGAARRPELQLNSVTTLFALLVASVIAHVAGYFMVNLVRGALVEAGGLLGRVLGPVIPDPYVAALKLVEGPSELIAFPEAPEHALESLATFVCVVLFETVVAFSLVRNPGLDIYIEPFDLRGQGWVYQNVVRPLRHGHRPIAYVFTTSGVGNLGVGYEGVVADIRQGSDGEVKALCLAEPWRFIYELRPADADPAAGRPIPDVQIHESEWVGGVVALEASNIRNLVIHNIEDEAVNEVVEPGAGETGEADVP